MDARLPDFFAAPVSLPPFFAAPSAAPVQVMTRTQLNRLVSAKEFEMVFPRILEAMSAGATASQAIKELPIPIDTGGFMRWLRKDPKRYELYQDAQEIRSEIWADGLIDLAMGKVVDGELPMELDRAKFAADQYRFLIKAQNKRVYGDTKTVEINQTVSIVGALEAAMGRANQVIDVSEDDYEVIGSDQYKQIEAATDDEGYGDDDA